MHDAERARRNTEVRRVTCMISECVAGVADDLLACVARKQLKVYFYTFSVPV